MKPIHCLKLAMPASLVPAFAVLTVNNRCNSFCPYCFVDSRKYPDIPLANIKNVIDELKELGCFEVTIQGGEALLRDDIGEIFEYIKSSGLRSHLVTNGKLIRERSDAMRLLDAVHVSLDGDREFTERTKNDADYFDRALDGLHLIKQIGVNCTIAALLLKGVTSQLDFLLSLSKEMGFGVQFLSPIKTGSAELNRRILIEDSEFEDAIRLLIRAKKSGYPVLSSAYALNKCLEWKRRYGQSYSDICRISEVPLSRNPCFAGRKFVFIDYQGFLSPCCIFQMKKANVYELGVEKSMQIISVANNCYDCINLPFIDFNAIFRYKPSVIMNYAFRMLKYR